MQAFRRITTSWLAPLSLAPAFVPCSDYSSSGASGPGRCVLKAQRGLSVAGAAAAGAQLLEWRHAAFRASGRVKSTGLPLCCLSLCVLTGIPDRSGQPRDEMQLGSGGAAPQLFFSRRARWSFHCFPGRRAASCVRSYQASEINPMSTKANVLDPERCHCVSEISCWVPLPSG